jgi:thioredoxin reductase (NADPH)
MSAIEAKEDTGKIYDMIVIGGGPGGYTAALYAVRAGMSTLVLERLAPGGQMGLTNEIDNYPGFEDGIDGVSLGLRMQSGAHRFGAETKLTEVRAVELDAPVKTIETGEGTFRARTVALATGAEPRKLAVAGEEELFGRGVHYCATCDGMGYRGKIVAIVGGGNTAVEDALLLARLCQKVILIHRRDTLRATKIYQERLFQMENVEFCWNSVVDGLLYDKAMTGVCLKNVKTGEKTDVPCDGLFVSIGRDPATALVRGQLELDGAGYVIADESTRTNLPGVFAVGDVRTKAVRQVVTAVSDGANAVYSAEEYLLNS